MQSQTLLSIIGKIRVQRIRLNSNNNIINTHWSLQDQSKFYQLIEQYGADFSIINNYFPNHSRKQIRKKYQEIEQRYCRKLERLEMRRDFEKRKNYFDEEILQNNLIKWLKKPNIAESSSSEDSV